MNFEVGVFVTPRIQFVCVVLVFQRLKGVQGVL